MDKLSHYQKIIKKLITQYHKDNHQYSYSEFETQMTFDDEHGHYYLIDVGWHDEERLYAPLLHLDLRNEKIWIQKDFTEQGIAMDLMELGVPKSDIVLAFQAPIKRPYTEFAVG